jgi:outer membrane protein assembly factor BamB
MNKRRNPVMRVAALALILSSALGLSACGGIKAPAIPFLKDKTKAAAEKLKGERIPVLSLNTKLEPSSALKGVGFSYPAATAQTSWPVPGGNAQHSVEHVQAAEKLQVAWRRKIGQGDTLNAHITAQPVAADGQIFTLDGQARVTALDAATGKPNWTVSLAPKKGQDREAYGGGIAYANGVLYLTSGYRFVAALDAKTGAEKWKTALPVALHGAPNLSDTKLFVVDTLDQLHAYDLTTGAEVWNYQALEEPARMQIASAPALDGEIIIAPFASGELTAVRQSNGNDVWSHVLSLTNRNSALSEIRDIAGLPVVYRGFVFAGSHSGVFAAVDVRTGQPLWQQPITSVTTPWVSGDVVFITDQSGQVICVSRDAGQAYWITPLNAGVKKKQRAIWSGPTLASDRLLVLSSKGELRALDPHTGEKVASLRLNAPASISPIAMDGLLYVLTDKGDLIAIK